MHRTSLAKALPTARGVPHGPAPRPLAPRLRLRRALTTTSLTSAGGSRPGSPPQFVVQHHAHGRNASSAAASLSTAPLRKTPLYDLHLAHGAKMVPFGGFHMPVQYASLSVGESHRFTRTHASLFDVSHMVQRIFAGPGAARFLQRVTPADLAAVPPHRSTLSCLMTADGAGGIVDDTVVTRLADGTFYVVTNAACRDKDELYFAVEMDKWNRERGQELWVEHSELQGQGLVALQGPESEAILGEALADPGALDVKKLLFGQSAHAKLKLGGPGRRRRSSSSSSSSSSSPLLISRGGYTGEDGFEISVPQAEAAAVTEALLAAGGPERVQLAGLGARDSLRLEAGMCLYGHDLDESTTPVEAGLSWIIPPARRGADAGYYGAEVLARQLVPRSKGGSGVQRRRVGLVLEGAPAREGAAIYGRAGAEGTDAAASIGSVTSGCPSPTLLGVNIAMGYVKDGFHKAGTEVDVLVRNRRRKAVVTKMPFVPTKYWKGIAPA